jgi:hypothetical protein
LILLSAAGVKIRERKNAAAQRHAKRAVALFRQLPHLAFERALGMSPTALAECAEAATRGEDTKVHKLSGSRERYENGLLCRSDVCFGAERHVERGLTDFDSRRRFTDRESLLYQHAGAMEFFGGDDRPASAPPAA